MSNMFIGDVAQMTEHTEPPTHILPGQRSPLERARGAPNGTLSLCSAILDRRGFIPIVRKILF